MKRPTKFEIPAFMEKIFALADSISPELDLQLEKFQEIIFDPAELDFDIAAPVPAAVGRPLPVTPKTARRTGSQKITIRIPDGVIDAFRAHAKATGVKYQTLMNRSLKDAMAGM